MVNQLEVDHRRIMRRISVLEVDLKELQQTRDLQRKSRTRRMALSLPSDTPTPASRRCSTNLRRQAL